MNKGGRIKHAASCHSHYYVSSSVLRHIVPFLQHLTPFFPTANVVLSLNKAPTSIVKTHKLKILCFGASRDSACVTFWNHCSKSWMMYEMKNPCSLHTIQIVKSPWSIKKKKKKKHPILVHRKGWEGGNVSTGTLCPLGKGLGGRRAHRVPQGSLCLASLAWPQLPHRPLSLPEALHEGFPVGWGF